jgi:hypothetical protein
LEERWAPAIFNVPAQMSLAAAITAAEAPGADKVNTINVAPGTYAVTEQLIQLASSSTLSIIGQGTGVILQSDGSNRVLEVKNGNVVLQNLAIEGGKVQAPAKTNADGGGLLIDAGNVTLINVDVSNNSARGADGAKSTGAQSSNAAPNGGSGTEACGGGIYVSSSGTLSLVNCNIEDNRAVGGNGGEGGTCQAQSPYVGGDGGWGGYASGGGIYVEGAVLILRQSDIENNVTQGGNGGTGALAGYSTVGMEERVEGRLAADWLPKPVS